MPPSPSKRPVKEWALRLVITLIAIIITQFGVTMFFLPALGSDPFTIFAQGWAKVLGISVGMSHLCIVVTLLVVIFIFQRKYILPGTFVCAFFAGPFLDVFVWVLGSRIHPEAAMWVRVGAVLVGTVITAIGLSLLLKADSGMSPNDLIAVILSDKLGVQFRWARVTTDTFYAATGFMLGGILGAGSLVSVFFVGPLIQFFLPYADRVVAWALQAAGLGGSCGAVVEPESH